MTSLKSSLFIEIKKHNPDLKDWTDDEMNTFIFQSPDSLRLSLAGFIRVRKIFTAYSFEIPKTIKTRHRFGMSKMEYPYYFTTKRLVLFSEMDAMMVKIHGGIEGFLETCSQIE